jgi:hypothetical protein
MALECMQSNVRAAPRPVKHMVSTFKPLNGRDMFSINDDNFDSNFFHLLLLKDHRYLSALAAIRRWALCDLLRLFCGLFCGLHWPIHFRLQILAIAMPHAVAGILVTKLCAVQSPLMTTL